MRSMLALLFTVFVSVPILADANGNLEEEFLPPSPLQRVLPRYESDFAYHHDRGLYFSAAIGPQWNHSLQNPYAKGIRFGGKLGLGWFIGEGLVIGCSGWGNFLEEASIIAFGPNIALFFSDAHIGLDFSLGIGRAFNAVQRHDIKTFSESVLAGTFSIGKFWWLSPKTSVGVSILSNLYGLTIAQGKLDSVGWGLGLGLTFLIG